MRIEIANSLYAALDLGKHELISLVGAGGKTSLMYKLGQELSRDGKVLLTTTTRIMYPDRGRVGEIILGAEIDQTIEAIGRSLNDGVVLAGRQRSGVKIDGFSPEFVDRIFTSQPDCTVVAESDGARGKSFKVPGDHEPPVASLTSVYVVVFGADSFGKPLYSDYVFRPHDVAARLAIDAGAKVSQEVVLDALLSENGYIKAKPSSARMCVFINKFETDGTGGDSSVLSFAHAIKSEGQIERVLLGSIGMMSERPVVVVR